MKLIVEMEMPRFCAECAMCDNVYYGDDVRKSFCVAFDERKEILTEDRPSWCPIKGVLPDEHGDLIDRDKFVDKYIRHYTEQERKMNLVFAAVEVKQDFADMIYEEDAVIAAERKDDEQIH